MPTTNVPAGSTVPLRRILRIISANENFPPTLSPASGTEHIVFASGAGESRGPMTTLPLFDSKTTPSAHIVPIRSAPLNKDQNAFNNLIKKIEARRQRLKEWEDTLPTFRHQYARELFTLEEQRVDLQCKLAQTLDAAHDGKGMTKNQKFKLGVVIADLAEAVLENRDDLAIKELYNKHSPWDFDEQEAESLNGVKSMLEGALGVDLGDDVDMHSPDDVMARVAAHFREQQEALEKKTSHRKTSRREEARARRQEAEEQQLSQSIRDVFRKLASALHPDREPDPEERQRKTVLMQRANRAYEKGNLLQLLELQLELEQIDADHLATIKPERLKHYIKILKGQLGDLDAEIQHIEAEVVFEFGLSPFEPIHPGNLLPLVKKEVTASRKQIDSLQQQIELAGDPKRLKLWLKTVSVQPQDDPDFDFLF